MWATPQDVQNAWIGGDAPTDTVGLETWIGKAERKLRRAVPDIGSRLTAGEEDLAENVRDVLVAMVTRVFRNPEGIRSTNITTGPFSENRTYGGDTPGGLVIEADELALLSGDAVRPRKAAAVDMIPTSSPFYGAAPTIGETW